MASDAFMRPFHSLAFYEVGFRAGRASLPPLQEKVGLLGSDVDRIPPLSSSAEGEEGTKVVQDDKENFHGSRTDGSTGDT